MIDSNFLARHQKKYGVEHCDPEDYRKWMVYIGDVCAGKMNVVAVTGDCGVFLCDKELTENGHAYVAMMAKGLIFEIQRVGCDAATVTISYS